MCGYDDPNPNDDPNQRKASRQVTPSGLHITAN